MENRKVNIAIVGCGYVSAFYIDTIQKFPNILLSGITDIINERAKQLAKYYKVPIYDSYDEILSNPEVEIIVNLTDPISHFEVSKKALTAGKHVYTEKPFCANLDQAKKLVSFAKKNNLIISSAPCSLLGPSAQAIWKLLKTNEIGDIRLVYAEMEDGPIFQLNPEKWRSIHGVPWPYKTEFRMGCILEHLGYAITWLIAFFGPAIHVTSFSECVVPKKMSDMEQLSAPDFSVAIIKHENGVVSRTTCGIVAPFNRGMKIVGEKGLISIKNFWDIYERPKKLIYSPFRLKAIRKSWVQKNWIFKKIIGLIPVKVSLNLNSYHNKLQLNTMDYCLGINDMAQSILDKSDPIINSDFSLHIAELTLKIHNSLYSGSLKSIDTTFDHEQFVSTNFKRFPT
jgi:predicted dehydrogenase